MRFLSVLLFFACIQVSGAQNQDSLALEEIRQLKAGALLVRLHSKKNSIDALKNQGQAGRAREVEQRQMTENKEIIAAFKNNFNFCPVYFFYSEYSNLVEGRQFDKVVFLNDQLSPDTINHFNFPVFFCAEFGNLEPDANGASTGISALIVQNDHFEQLKRPFPYYVGTMETLGLSKTIKKDAVIKLNKKLKDFCLKMH